MRFYLLQVGDDGELRTTGEELQADAEELAGRLAAIAAERGGRWAAQADSPIRDIVFSE